MSEQPKQNTFSFKVGDTSELEVEIRPEFIDQFATLSGDDNPLHMNEETARQAGFAHRVVHGVLSLSYLSRLIGTQLPGTGALWRSLNVEWLRPLFPMDRLRIIGTVKQISPTTNSIILSIEGTNQNRTQVLRAEAVIGITGFDISQSSAEPLKAVPAKKLVESDSASKPAVFVTGASRGIGRAIAIKLAGDGFPVAVGYKSRLAEANDVVETIQAANGKAIAVQVNVESYNDTQKTFQSAEQLLGTILGIVHCATPSLLTKPVDELTTEDFDQYWNVYVHGGLALVHSALSAMKQQKWGRIVFIGTSAAMGAPPPKMSAYVAAKSGMVGFAKSLAIELGPFGVTVNTVSPSMVATELTRDYAPRTLLSEAQRTPLRRLAKEEDIAETVAFLFSEQASFMTGAVLPLTGGITLP